MFKTYNVSSNGLDGLVPLYYHVLAYYIGGSLSNLLGISSLTFYNITYPILIIPITLVGFIYCIEEISKYYTTKYNIITSNVNHIKYWILLCVLSALPLPYQIVGYLGGERYQYFTSHSYSFALFNCYIFWV